MAPFLPDCANQLNLSSGNSLRDSIKFPTQLGADQRELKVKRELNFELRDGFTCCRMIDESARLLLATTRLERVATPLDSFRDASWELINDSNSSGVHFKCDSQADSINALAAPRPA